MTRVAELRTVMVGTPAVAPGKHLGAGGQGTQPAAQEPGTPTISLVESPCRATIDLRGRQAVRRSNRFNRQGAA